MHIQSMYDIHLNAHCMCVHSHVVFNACTDQFVIQIPRESRADVLSTIFFFFPAGPKVEPQVREMRVAQLHPEPSLSSFMPVLGLQRLNMASPSWVSLGWPNKRWLEEVTLESPSALFLEQTDSDWRESGPMVSLAGPSSQVLRGCSSDMCKSYEASAVDGYLHWLVSRSRLLPELCLHSKSCTGPTGPWTPCWHIPGDVLTFAVFSMPLVGLPDAIVAWVRLFLPSVPSEASGVRGATHIQDCFYITQVHFLAHVI